MAGNTFNLDRKFLSRLVDSYQFEQEFSFKAAIEDPFPELHEKPREPFSRERIERHIKELIEVSFWASLRKEEGHHPRFSLIYEPSRYSADRKLFTFEKSLPFNVRTLVKLAPALQSTSNIGVWPNAKNQLVIWGFTPVPLMMPLYIKTIEPGQLIL